MTTLEQYGMSNTKMGNPNISIVVPKKVGKSNVRNV